MKFSSIELKQPLTRLEQAWLVGNLCARRGVYAVTFDESNSRRFRVDFDADIVSSGGILDFLFDCGLPAAPARPHVIAPVGSSPARPMRDDRSRP